MALNMDVVTADVIGDTALVLGASHLFGALARKLGQPTVVGQIVAGIALGPSLLGRLPGDPSHRLFTGDAVPFITAIAQIAVVVFMFGVGYEIDTRSVRRRGRPVLMISAGAMLIPLVLGADVAFGVEHLGAFDGHHSLGRSFLLFMGVATSITALPVLAAIVRERGIAGTVVGDVATAAAGLMDVVAWLILALALVGTKAAGSRSWPAAALLLVVFVAAMFLVIRPALAWWIRRPGAVVASQVPAALVLAMAGAWATAALGLHPIFGAFVAGLAMPKPQGVPDAEVLRSTELVGGLLMPLFFVVTGLTADIGALNAADVALLGAILLCGIGGKLAGGYAMARLGGMDARRSALIGALVNTRGLTELIALNVGLRAGIIDARLFTILVLMALITTVMAGPLISAVHRKSGVVLIRSAPDPAPASGVWDQT